jgi:ABC-type amino acid transport substrate-binding protein
MKKLLLYTWASALVVFMIVSCADTTKSTVNVAISPDFYPFAFAVSDTLQGIEVELLSHLERRLSARMNITRIHFSLLLESFLNGEDDIAIGGITITENRKALFDFSMPYYDATQTFLMHRAATPIDSLEAIRPLRIGVLNNSSSLFFVEDTMIRQMAFSANNLRRYPNQTALVNALKNNEVGAILTEHTVARFLSERHDFSIVYTHDLVEEYAIVTKKGSTMSRSVNRALDKILKSDSWEVYLKSVLLD